MYELRDFDDGGQLLDYLNGLGNHEVISANKQNGGWSVLVKITKMGRPVRKTEEPTKLFEAEPTGFPMRDL